ncbi:MAG: N-acetyltransferase [Gammaproteobacteria bacterium]|nr:N-acetyltransferase [Gammaproteobacteria bacterium]
MKFRQGAKNDSKAIAQLFASVFTDSDGDDEGLLISQLAAGLFESTDEQDLYNFVAVDVGRIVGSIFFSRVTVEHGLDAFILAPVAVLSDRQGEGIGQGLINHGLGELRRRGVSLVLTYGDPRFYRKVGFHHVSPEILKPPFELTQPEGWLGQSLVDDPIEAFSGRLTCVEALSSPVYW